MAIADPPRPVLCPVLPDLRTARPSDIIDAWPDDRFCRRAFFTADGKACAWGILRLATGLDFHLAIRAHSGDAAPEDCWLYAEQVHDSNERLLELGWFGPLAGMDLIQISDRKGKAAVVAALRAKGI